MEIDGNMQGAVLYVDCPRCKKRNMIMPKVKAKIAVSEHDDYPRIWPLHRVQDVIS